MYYNTNKETGTVLQDSRQRTVSQEKDILNYFTLYGEWTADEVWENLYYRSILLTSVRRAISTLVTKGELIKTPKMKMGCFGKMVHVYSLPSNQLTLNL